MPPELMHSERCMGEKCTKCTDRNTCFHGGGHGSLEITIPKGTGKAGMYYQAQVWARCAGWAKTKWRLLVGSGSRPTKNSKVSLEYYDPDGRKTAWSTSKSGSMNFKVSKDTLVKVIMQPNEPAESAFASVSLSIPRGQLPPFTSKCMGTKLCLRLLAMASPWWTLDDEFQLHNDNSMQYMCLTSPAKFNQRYTENLAKLCKRLTRCLTKRGGTERIVAVLKAAVAVSRKHSLISQTTETTAADAPGQDDALPASYCWDPSVMDPEAVECACMDKWHPQCQSQHGIRSAYDRCIQCKMCEQDNQVLPLCKPWKEAADCKGCPSLMQVAKQEDNNTKTSMAKPKQDSLDSTVQGKCGS